jgi:hypothetical protein
LDSRLEQLVAREFGQFWSVVMWLECAVQRFCLRVSLDYHAGGFRLRRLGAVAKRIELAIKRGAADAQPPRELGHLTAVMRHRESATASASISSSALPFPSSSASAAGGLCNRGCK